MRPAGAAQHGFHRADDRNTTWILEFCSSLAGTADEANVKVLSKVPATPAIKEERQEVKTVRSMRSTTDVAACDSAPRALPTKTRQ
jgi:hypothetical protein